MNGYYNPVKIYQEPGCAARVGEVLEELGTGKRALLLAWNTMVFQQPAFAGLLQPSFSWEVRTCCFQMTNPTMEQLFEVYQETKEFAPDVVIAVGGGSTLDIGKSLCCLYGKEIPNVAALRVMIQSKEYGRPGARWIGIPTTAGTGSETTCWATIWDPSKDAKRSVESRENFAYAALVDPEMSKSMPLGLAVNSALDAAAHAVESYWAKGTNSVSRALALCAVRTIMKAMDGLLAGRPEAHNDMAKGSMLAGLAFSSTRTTACHSISYPLTMRCGIPHGAAVSLLLAPVLRLNLGSFSGQEELLEALGAADADELEEKIGNYLRRASLPSSLQEWGVKREELRRLAQFGVTKGRADNNPVEINAENILHILEQAYSARPIRKGA